jgi:hypothetical protein
MRTRITTIVLLLLLFGVAAIAADEPKPDTVRVKKDLLGDAIGRAIRSGIEDAMAKLEIRDDVEVGLMREATKGKHLGSPSALSIVLLRPAEEKESRKDHEFANPDMHFKIRMTKVRTKHVSRPTGIIVHNALRDGEMVVEESVLQLGADGKWAKQ